MQSWETLSRRVILEHSKYLCVESHDIRLPNGEIIQDWPWIITPDFVNVIVTTQNEEFILFRQTKYSIDGVGLAPVGGYLNPDEQPLDAAKRELKEELGYSSEKWVPLGAYPVDGNRGVGVAHLYLAIAARPDLDKANYASDDLEEQEIVFLSKAQVYSAMVRQEFKVLPWITAIALSLHILA